MRSANRPRQQTRFFTAPTQPSHRRYEALRAYFVDGATSAEAARLFGYAPGTVEAMVRDFRNGDRQFFAERRPGPRRAPAKEAARAEVIRLRRAGHSITEITEALAGTDTPLNRTGVWELLKQEGYERLAVRAPAERGGPRREHPPRVRALRFPDVAVSSPTDFAGVLLLVPGLVALDLPGAVAKAKFPGTREVPALSSVLSLLALKATGRARVSHVDDVATDPGLAAFAGLETLPKATALGTYSYRLARRHDQALLRALGPAMLRTGQAAGKEFDLDFHAIMHYGDDVALETHYVPRRSQRTEAVLTFFAQDGETRNLVYADATCSNTDRAEEVLRFVRHWRTATGWPPELLVFDSKVTTGAGLAALDREGIRFLTLRQRNPKLMASLAALPDGAWKKVTLDRSGPYRHPEVSEDVVTVRGCEVPLRQIAVRGLGHESPTLVLTNDRKTAAGKLVNRYAKRMVIEQRLAESIRSFHLDALSSAVALNVDLDTTLTVWAQVAYDALRRRLPGYEKAAPETIWRRFVSTRGRITIGPNDVVVRLKNRTYSPVMRSSHTPVVKVPWWGGRHLRFVFD
ncbi:MAG: hypothetical protein HYU54_01140 [Actinobacteria bacterium]|nr:hypothetical protein [Actinomycetota bacterium]